MDKKEYNIRLEQIESLVKEHSFEEAMEVCDIINWRKVQKLRTLCMVSEIYAANRRYEDARDILLLAYNKNPESRHVVSSLCKLSIKLNDLVNAVNYQRIYERMAPGSAQNYILKYLLYKLEDVSYEERIALLEKYKKVEDVPGKWNLELAKLYELVGSAQKCVQECDEIILMATDNRVILKAMELKQEHKPLTAMQQEKQKHIMKLESGEDPEVFEDTASEEESAAYEDGEAGYAEASGEEYDRGADAVDDGNYETEAAAGSVSEDTQEDEIQVKQLSGDKFSTMNIQEDLSEDVKAFFKSQEAQAEGLTVQSQDGETLNTGDLQTATDLQVPSGETAEEEKDQTQEETFFGNHTAALAFADEDALALNQANEAALNDIRATGRMVYDEDEGENYFSNVPENIEPVVKPVSGYASGVTRTKSSVLGSGAAEGVAPVAENAVNRMLRQDGDGQISMVIPEPESVEKQITGQISMSGFMSEWEEQRKESQRRRIAGAKRKNLEQTNNIASELEGILPRITGELPTVEQIEKDVVLPEEDVEKTMRNIEMLKQGYDTGELPYMSAMKDAPAPEDYISKNMAKALSHVPLGTDRAFTQELPTQELPMQELPTQELPVQEYYPEEAEYDESQDEYYEPEGVEEIPEIEDELSQEAYQDVPAAEYAGEGEYQDDSAAEYAGEGEYQDDPAAEYAGEGEYQDDPAAEYAGEGEYQDDPAAQYAGEGEYQDDPAAEYTDEAAYTDQAYAGEEVFSEADKFDTSQIPTDDYATGELPGYEASMGEDAAVFAEDEAVEDESDSADAGDAELDIDDMYLESDFGDVIHIRKLKGRIKRALALCSMNATVGNVVICGNEKSVRMEVAMGISKYMKSTEVEFTGMRKIDAGVLNSKDIRKAIPKLNNGALVIENAGKMTVNTLDTLAKAVNHPSIRMIIILEDEKNEIRKLSSLRSYFANMFPATIEVPTYSNNDLVEYAKRYALEKEYTIDDMGILALHSRIDELQTSTHFVTTKEVEEIMDAAMNNVDKKNLVLLKNILFAKRYDENDLIILRESNFVK
ncbi:MAG: hypothetical protein IJM23_07340 [Lachnospiraceae bacterium]|nr:hypothetical protein [Lachnospiraceae bacterium]